MIEEKGLFSSSIDLQSRPTEKKKLAAKPNYYVDNKTNTALFPPLMIYWHV